MCDWWLIGQWNVETRFVQFNLKCCTINEQWLIRFIWFYIYSSLQDFPCRMASSSPPRHTTTTSPRHPAQLTFLRASSPSSLKMPLTKQCMSWKGNQDVYSASVSSRRCRYYSLCASPRQFKSKDSLMRCGSILSCVIVYASVTMVCDNKTDFKHWHEWEIMQFDRIVHGQQKIRNGFVRALFDELWDCSFRLCTYLFVHMLYLFLSVVI